MTHCLSNFDLFWRLEWWKCELNFEIMIGSHCASLCSGKQTMLLIIAIVNTICYATKSKAESEFKEFEAMVRRSF